MDGNRRFAASRNCGRERGHEFGAEKLLDVLEWCLALGVRCLSVYAFSTDNFKRSEAEIATLMDLAERRLDELAESDAIEPRRVRVQVLGEVHTLPPGVRRAAARVTSATWHHDGPVLNVCFAYTGRGGYRAGGGVRGRRRATRRSRRRRRRRTSPRAMSPRRRDRRVGEAVEDDGGDER